MTMAARVSSWRVRRASTGMGLRSTTQSAPRSWRSLVRSGTAMQKRLSAFPPMRLEPDAVAIDEADDRGRDTEQVRGQRGEAVASGFGRGIEDLVAQHRRKTQAVVVGGHRGRGYENVETAALCRLDQMQPGSRPRTKPLCARHLQNNTPRSGR